jgi:hypothetical protein
VHGTWEVTVDTIILYTGDAVSGIGRLKADKLTVDADSDTMLFRRQKNEPPRDLEDPPPAFGPVINVTLDDAVVICSLAYSGTGSLSQSEDLAQETFIAAWKQLAHLREPCKLRSWLWGIARNRICDALKKQVRAFVEGALERTAPGKAFTLGVVAALPLFVTTASAGSVGATVANGSVVAKAAASAGVAGAILGPLIGVLGGILGTKASIENTDSPRERRFMVQTAKWIWALAISFALAIWAFIAMANAWWKTHPILIKGIFIGAVFKIYRGRKARGVSQPSNVSWLATASCSNANQAGRTKRARERLDCHRQCCVRRIVCRGWCGGGANQHGRVCSGLGGAGRRRSKLLCCNTLRCVQLPWHGQPHPRSLQVEIRTYGSADQSCAGRIRSWSRKTSGSEVGS